MFSFSFKLRLKGLVFPALLFISATYAQDSSPFIGCRAPSSNLISAMGLDSFVYYTPRPYKLKSYIVRWNFVTDVKDSLSFSLPYIEGDFNYRLTGFSTDGVRFVYCFVDYVYVYTLKDKHFVLQASKHFKNKIIEECFITPTGLVLVTSSTNNKGDIKKISYTTNSLSERMNTSLVGSELSLSHLKPAKYFAYHDNNLLWLKPISQTIDCYTDGKYFETKTLQKQFASPDSNLVEKLSTQRGLEGKMSIIVSEFDSLEFDYLEEIHIINGRTFLLFSAKGCGMSVKKHWHRLVAVLSDENTVSERYLISNDFDVMNIIAFEFNKSIYFIENSVGILKVYSLNDIAQAN